MTISNIPFTHVTSSRKTAEATNSQILAAKIESVAHFLKMATQCGYNLRGETKHGLRCELILLLMEIKKLTSFMPGRAQMGKTMEELPQGKSYSSTVFYNAFESAWKIYLSHDLAHDLREPFLMIFNGLYKKQRGKIVDEIAAEKHAWENDYKKQALNKLLLQAVEEISYEEDLKRVNPLNEYAFKKQLLDIGAPLSYLDAADSIYSDSHVISNDCYDDEDVATGRATSDEAVIADYEYANVAIGMLLDVIERVKLEAATSKDPAVRRNLNYYITLKAREYVMSGDPKLVMLLEDYLDKSLLSYALAQGQRGHNDVYILSKYTNQEYDTTRKKLRKVEKALLAVAA